MPIRRQGNILVTNRVQTSSIPGSITERDSAGGRISQHNLVLLLASPKLHYLEFAIHIAHNHQRIVGGIANWSTVCIWTQETRVCSIAVDRVDARLLASICSIGKVNR